MATPAAADLLYDNGPADSTSFTPNLDTAVYFRQTTGSTFTLAEDATITSVRAGIWWETRTFNDFGWSLGTTPNGWDLAYGFAPSTNTFVATQGTYSLYDVSFDITPTFLTAGTYSFNIGNSTANFDYTPTYWADSSTGTNQTYHTNYRSGAYAVPGSVSYQLYGTAVPEPTSLALLGLGGLMLMRRRR